MVDYVFERHLSGGVRLVASKSVGARVRLDPTEWECLRCGDRATACTAQELLVAARSVDFARLAALALQDCTAPHYIPSTPRHH